MAKNKGFALLICSLLALTCLAGKGTLREQVKKTYTDQIGVYEATGQNDGTKVEMYLKAVGLRKGQPWCAAFVSWTLQQNNVDNPRSGYSPDWFTRQSNIIYLTGRVKQVPQSGDVFGIYFRDKVRVAHVGFIDTWADKYALTVEGNTNQAGSREGDGVYKKKRLHRQIYAISDWIK